MQRWALLTLVHARHVLAYALLLIPLVASFFQPVYAIPQVQERSVRISDSEASSVATHRFGFRYTDFANPVGSVSFEYCSNSPIPQITCVAPSGFDASSAALATQTGQIGFSVNGAESTANKIVLSRAALVPGSGAAMSSYIFNNVTNPDSVGSYYVRVQTFTSTDGTGSALEDGGLVFAIVSEFNVSAEVPPHLLFCAAVTITGFDCSSATSFFIDLGEFSQTEPRVASSQMLAATNAGFGFSITLAGTTLTSGNNIIPALNNQTSSAPGTSQFGLNLRANTNPSIGTNPAGPGAAGVTGAYAVPNRFKFTQGDIVANSQSTSDYRKFTVSYLVNIDDAQAAGVYATTVSFIALANF